MTQSTSLILALASPDVRIPEFAPFVVIAFLGPACFLFATVVGGAIALAFRKPRMARGIGAAALLADFGYAALLLGASFLSREKTLPPGAKKYFCEIGSCAADPTDERGPFLRNLVPDCRLYRYDLPQTAQRARRLGS